MGYRSIRLSTGFPEFFITQVRAILRAAVHGNVELLFPMVSTIEEVRSRQEAVSPPGRRRAPAATGWSTGTTIPLGVMMEVPAAALCIDTILAEVDFISIGSNDLIQYVMAADRDNPKVAHLCEPFNPALMRLLAHIIRHCIRANKPVTLCGEMAGPPRCYVPLMGTASAPLQHESGVRADCERGGPLGAAGAKQRVGPGAGGCGHLKGCGDVLHASRRNCARR